MKKFLWISIIIFGVIPLFWACREAPTLSKIDEENDSPLFSDSHTKALSNFNSNNINGDITPYSTSNPNDPTCDPTNCSEPTAYGTTCESQETCGLYFTCNQVYTCQGFSTCYGGQLTCWATCSQEPTMDCSSTCDGSQTCNMNDPNCRS